VYEYLGSLAAQLGVNPSNGHLVFLFTLIFIALTTAQILCLRLGEKDQEGKEAIRGLTSFAGAILVGLMFYFAVEALMKITVYLGPVAYVAVIIWLLVIKNRIWRRLRQQEVEAFNARTKAPAPHG